MFENPPVDPPQPPIGSSGPPPDNSNRPGPTSAPGQPVEPAQPTPPPPRTGPPPQPWWTKPPKKTSWGKRILLIILGLMLASSVVANVILIIALAATRMDVDRTLSTRTLRAGRTSETVAVYSINGIIDGQAAARFQQFYNEIARDKNVKAVVLRVASPGGGMAASDQIYCLVEKLKMQHGKKIVVSMGSVAASGGYYVSAAADEIVAEPTCITGSIGVMMGWMVVKGTLDKIGVESIILKSRNAQGWKDEISSFRKPHARQRAHLQELLDKLQARFEQVVRTGRGARLKTKKISYTMTMPAGDGKEAKKVPCTEIEPLNGKIYLPADALKLGLIDQIGYQDKAIDLAIKLANLRKPHVVRYQRRRSLIEMLTEGKAFAGLRVDAKLLENLGTPRVMMIWKVQ